MHAMLVDHNHSLRWTEVPESQPKADEVLIQVAAAALNRADLMQRAGEYPSPEGWPTWMGLEVSGHVLKAPSDSRFKPGMPVCALLGGGGYAERVAVPSGLVLPVPPGVSMTEAAAIPEVFATAYLNLCFEAELKAGETVFIQAGASGLGSAAIQLAKLYKARVVTSVGSQEKVFFVKKLGADIAANRKLESLEEILKTNPVDIALDCVAGPDMGKLLYHMARGGRWIVIATLAGSKTELDLNAFFRKGLRLIGSTLRSRSLEVKTNLLQALEKELWPKFSSGDLKSIVHHTYPMTQAEEAHQCLSKQENLGKLVLTLP